MGGHSHNQPNVIAYGCEYGASGPEPPDDFDQLPGMKQWVTGHPSPSNLLELVSISLGLYVIPGGPLLSIFTSMVSTKLDSSINRLYRLTIRFPIPISYTRWGTLGIWNQRSILSKQSL